VACAALLALALLAAPLVPDAQTTAKPARVGIIGLTPNVPANFEMFRQGLAERGYVVGQHVVVDIQDAGNVPARMAETAARMAATKPDIIFTRGPDAIVAMLRVTTSIPIVAVDLESDPLAMGFVKSIARPGGNVPGIFMDQPEMSAKQLQLLREVIPGLSRVALIGDLTGNAAQFRATERAAQSFGVHTAELP
jgi:putative ABC transport system substrate-binding protein